MLTSSGKPTSILPFIHPLFQPTSTELCEGMNMFAELSARLKCRSNRKYRLPKSNGDHEQNPTEVRIQVKIIGNC
jgi:hypothetical protein